MQEFRDILYEVDWGNVYSKSNLNDAYKRFSGSFLRYIQSSHPSKNISVKIKNSAKSLNDQRPFKIFKAEAKIVQKILKNNNPR